MKMVELDELLQQSDYITIHSSATEETYHLINEDRLAMMKSTALLVNTARGPIVDGRALARALKEGVIEGAGLDVTEGTNRIGRSASRAQQLHSDPSCCRIFPTFLEDCAVRQAENIIFALTGIKPHGLANPEVIKT